jgi:hypothetical protein
VTATTAGGTTDPQQFTYVPAPTATGIDPTSGPTAGDTTVTLTGTGFVPDATTVTIGGQTIDAGDVTVTSPTTLTFATPAHAAGGVNVTATTAGGTTDPQRFTYLARPTASGIDPDHGSTAGGTRVTLTGTGFVPGTTVAIGGQPGTDVTVTSPTTLTFTTPAHDAGTVDVTATTPGGTTAATENFRYIAPPTITTLDPDHGPAAGGNTVEVTGTGFTDASTAVVDGTTVPTTVTSGTTLSFVAPEHAAGPVDVTVDTEGVVSDPARYTFDPAPTITTLDPTHGPASGGNVVAVTGTGFLPGSTVTIGGTAVPATVTSGTTLTFTAPDHAAGDVTVTVKTEGQPSGTAAYTYDPAPAITALDPNNGPAAGGNTVTVTGTNFVDGATVTVDGQTVPATVTDPTTLTFTAPEHGAGDVPVIVVNPDGQNSGQATYTYNAPPAITSLDPDHGPAAGGTAVTITGTGFTDGSTITVDGQLVPVDSVNGDGTQLQYTAPAGTPGPASVVVTTVNGSSQPETYTYDAAAPGTPTVTALDPGHGPAAGGTTVTVTGTGFTNASTVTIGGKTVTPTVVSGTSLTFTTPEHAAGAVTVMVTTDGNESNPQTYVYDPATAATPVVTGLAPNHGPTSGGTSVTVSGTGFTGTSTVSVDGSDPIVPDSVAADGTSLTFTTPEHAVGGVPVTVTTDLGTSGARTFTYEAVTTSEPAPVITDPSNGDMVTTATPMISGTGDPGATLTVREADTTVCTTTVRSDGTWSCKPTNGLGEGWHTIMATQTGAGGTSGMSDPVRFAMERALVPGGGSGTGGSGTGASSGNGTGSGDTVGSGSSAVGSGSLAYTGSAPLPMLGFALMMLLAGITVAAVRRLRRR